LDFFVFRLHSLYPYDTISTVLFLWR
jgi:hypothetical protein